MEKFIARIPEGTAQEIFESSRGLETQRGFYNKNVGPGLVPVKINNNNFAAPRYEKVHVICRYPSSPQAEFIEMCPRGTGNIAEREAQ